MRKLIDLIKYSGDARLVNLKDMIASEKRKLIYGAGRCARNTYSLLSEYGIEIDGFCVDSEYYESGKKICDKEVYDVNKLLSSDNELIIGFENRARAISVKERLREKGVKVYHFEDLFCFRFMDYKFFIDNYVNYLKAYSLLCDELSKEIFVAHINSRIAGDYSEISKYNQQGKYGYDFEILKLSDKEVFVDCGAFDGDTIEEFLDYTNGKYSKIFAFEPDEANKTKLETKNNGRNDVKVIPKGVGNKNGIEKFYNDGSLYSNFVDSGLWGGKSRRDVYKDVDNYIEVPICRIDDEIQGEPVSFIKMDIEDSELSALIGAAETITSNHPKLAICAYHKSEDMFTCVNYVESIVGSGVYHYYLRHHSDDICETVLYANPI